MATDRNTLPIWRRRLPLIAGLVVILIAVIVLIVLVNSPVHSPAATVAPNQAETLYQKMHEIASSLETFNVEYGKIAAGTDKSKTGAPGALNDAMTMFTAVQPDLANIDQFHTDGLKTALDALKAILDGTKPDPNGVTLNVVKVNQHLAALTMTMNKGH
ncbi:MAG TPA: hypothetical protein VMT34_16965 [Aggregatilineales bacterium]|nr:hypothetical protein [Aggregatilineales bacterium]